MPEGVFNQKELRVFDDLNKNLKSIDKSIKDFMNAVKQLNSRTNKNTLTHRLVEAVEKVADEIKEKGKGK